MGLKHDDPRPGSAQSRNEDDQPQTCAEMLKKWPKQTFMIIGNEFCERFSFYGMRAILTLYFLNILNFSESTSSVMFHIFTVVCYSTPILGSILADGYIGKFWTIFSISILYTCGQILLAITSTLQPEHTLHPGLDFLGLLIVGLGTGGIKPCVSAFGGDQFNPHYTRMISVFFSIFYFSINAGSLISMFLTPKMRAIPCLGNDSCYPLAFGIPAILMIFATLVFMSGSVWYKKVPPKENIIFRVIGTMFRALRKKFTSSRNDNRSHWLEYSLDGHRCEKSKQCKELHGNCAERKLIDDIKVLIRVCVMLIPVPMFWALYDQQGSTWVIQAVSMDSRIFGSFKLLPDQMGVVNALLILVFIPIFQSIIYPGVERCGIRVTMLRKMAAGGILTALAFFVAGFVQLYVNKSLPTLPMANEAHLSIINVFPSCDFTVQIDTRQSMALPAINSNNDQVLNIIKFQSGYQFKPAISFITSAPNCANFTAHPNLVAGASYIFTLSPVGWTLSQSKLEKPKSGNGEYGMGLNMLVPCDKIPSNVTWKGCTSSTDRYSGTMALCKQDEFTDPANPCDPKLDGRYYHYYTDSAITLDVNDNQNGAIEHFGVSYPNIEIEPGEYKLYYINYTVPYTKRAKPTASETMHVEVGIPTIKRDNMGGVYTLTISPREKQADTLLSTIETLVPQNSVSILWQIPQYVILTAGEVLFSITGLEFAYKEASPQLKSVVQALWLFTTAIGDLIDVAIIALHLFSDMAIQMFVFGVIMLIVIAVFILLSIFYYQYADYEHQDDNETFVTKGIEEDNMKTRI